MTVDIEYELYEGFPCEEAFKEDRAGLAKADGKLPGGDEELMKAGEELFRADRERIEAGDGHGGAGVGLTEPDEEAARALIDKLLGIDTRAVISRVSGEALRQEGCPWEATFDVLITGDEEIREINYENRGIDRPTDVLSFPMVSFDEPGDFSVCDDPAFLADFFDPESGELVLGSIVLSVPRILAQAKEYGHSVEREFAFLVAHSMFHLMGYDHMTDAEESVMKQKQYSVLDALGIAR